MEKYGYDNVYRFSSPHWGFLYLIIHILKGDIIMIVFSSPHWGFLYLMSIRRAFNDYKTVLVPSLGISLFNNLIKLWKWFRWFVLVPSLGISLFNANSEYLSNSLHIVLVPSLGISLFNWMSGLPTAFPICSRPLVGDFFI